MRDVLGMDSTDKMEKTDHVAEAKSRAEETRLQKEADIEFARVEGIKHRITEFYWNNISAIYLNGVECKIRRVDAVGGARNVPTGRGEVKAWGGDFIVTMPDGDEVVMSRANVEILDKASGATHVDAEGEVIPVPSGYLDFDESLLSPPDIVIEQIPNQGQGVPGQTEPTLQELLDSDERKRQEALQQQPGQSVGHVGQQVQQDELSRKKASASPPHQPSNPIPDGKKK